MNKIDEIALRVARAIWNIRREDEDRCDMELEDIGRNHSVFKEAEAVLAELSKDAEPTCIVSDIGVIQNITDCPLEPGLRLFDHPAPVIASEQKPEYYEYRAFYGDNTVNPGWGDWLRVEARSHLSTVEDAVSELKDYIASGCKYEIRELFTSPPNTADIEQRVAEACRKMAVSWGNARLDDNGGHALRNFATAVEIEEWRKYL